MKKYYDRSCKFCGASPIRIGIKSRTQGAIRRSINHCCTCGKAQK